MLLFAAWLALGCDWDPDFRQAEFLHPDTLASPEMNVIISVTAVDPSEFYVELIGEDSPPTRLELVERVDLSSAYEEDWDGPRTSILRFKAPTSLSPGGYGASIFATGTDQGFPSALFQVMSEGVLPPRPVVPVAIEVGERDQGEDSCGAYDVVPVSVDFAPMDDLCEAIGCGVEPLYTVHLTDRMGADLVDGAIVQQGNAIREDMQSKEIFGFHGQEDYCVTVRQWGDSPDMDQISETLCLNADGGPNGQPPVVEGEAIRGCACQASPSMSVPAISLALLVLFGLWGRRRD